MHAWYGGRVKIPIGKICRDVRGERGGEISARRQILFVWHITLCQMRFFSLVIVMIMLSEFLSRSNRVVQLLYVCDYAWPAFPWIKLASFFKTFCSVVN